MKDTKNKHKGSRLKQVAIIGIGCLFPKAPGVKEYWRLLSRGEDAIIDNPDTHWSAKDYYSETHKKQDHTYCARGGFLSAIPFNPAEFGIPPNSMEATDTSQLLGLVATQMALDDAGYGDGKEFNRDKTSVVLGVTGTQELVISMGSRLGHPKWRKALQDAGIPSDKTEEIIERISDQYAPWQENSFPGLLGNVVAGRISNRFDLGGTNTVLDSACASSLSAVNLAFMELQTGRSDMVLTGGVDALNDIFMNMCFAQTGVLSHTGDSKPFSEKADGTVLGEGVGIIALKRLEDAERDGDRIYSILKSVGSSSDGKSMSIYAPSAKGQAKAANMAYSDAGVNASTIELVEAHGTGTRVGDAVEFEGLRKVFGNASDENNRVALGSVKSMIGHTKAAAGVAGLIKGALALYHKVLPPTLKIDTPDPKLDINNSPFYLSSTSRPWVSRKEHPRRCGVTACGFGGSNFHALLEEYRPEKEMISWDGSVQIIAFSAQSQNELFQQLKKLAETLNSDQATREFSGGFPYIASETRKSFVPNQSLCIFIVLQKDDEPLEIVEKAISLLQANGTSDSWNTGGVFLGGEKNQKDKLAFIFPGQGSQYTGMGKDIITAFPEAVSILEAANDLFGKEQRLSDILYPLTDHVLDKKSCEDNLRKTDHAQPGIGAVSLAMHKVLSRFGVKPDMTCGHSFGELTALCAAGWIDDSSLLSLAAARGRFMAGNGEDRGTMLAVKAPLAEIEKLITANNLDVILANRNTQEQGVLSGSKNAISQAETLLKKAGFGTTRLPVAAAFHSSLVEDAAKPFCEFLKNIKITPTKTQVFSNTTGTPYPENEAEIKKILGRQLAEPVNFVEEIENLYESGVRTFVEAGPKAVLSGLVKTILKGKYVNVISTDPSAGTKFGIYDLAQTLCGVASAGFPVDFTQWEAPCKKPKKQMMNIPICGANHPHKIKERPVSPPFIPATETPVAVSKKTTVVHTITKPRDTEPLRGKKQPPVPAHVKKEAVIPGPTPITGRKTMTGNPTKPSVISDALKVVQDGLRSMQALQAQTAQAHTKFLETQNEAGKTLQDMMDKTRQMAEMAMNFSGTTAPWPVQEATPAAKTVHHVKPQDAPVYRKPEPVVEATVVRTSPVQSPKKAATPAPAAVDVEGPLLEVVSCLTGYPVEMLGLDMDIEADLGIDSIKRVEILSSVEEKMPGMPPVSADVMGTLKTLGQICDYLNELTGTAAPQPVKTAAGPDSKQITATLLEVVSELTGYPVEMLGLEMDIEADLGIDSIKRVEILSAFEEKMPDMPPVSADVMGTLKSLGQISDYLNGLGGTPASLPETPASGVDSKAVTTALLDVVSELTGYPAEMLGLDMDLEADLGIDSIKRVEIMASFEDRMPGCGVSNPDEMAKLKTLGQICDYITQAGSESPNITAPANAQVMEETKAEQPLMVMRQLVAITPKEADRTKPVSIPKNSLVYVAGENKKLAKQIVAELTQRHIKSKRISKGKTPENSSGLIILSDFERKRDRFWDDQDEQFLKNAFEMAVSNAASLNSHGAKGGSIFATVTCLDGTFGFKGGHIKSPLTGGLAGLSKTAALEWEDVTCKAIDVDPEWKNTEEIARAIVDEVLFTNDVEVGLSQHGRVITELKQKPVTPDKLHLNDGDVVLVSGGARGVTAAASIELASHVKATFILMGRSKEPAAEPHWLSGIENEAAMKKAILSNDFQVGTVSPKELESAYRTYCANREVTNTMEQIHALGSKALYFPADIRNPENVKEVLNTVTSNYGPVKALIHGAGVLEDRLIAEKTLNQYDRVFGTKAKGLDILLSALDHEALNHLVLFSSVSARMGNTGQVDYAMANEVLNKLARSHSEKNPQCRVNSINWGPWDGGMVSPALKREFEKRGISLIPIKQGARAMVDEMMARRNGATEVVIGGTITPTAEKQASSGQPGMTLAFNKEVDTTSYPFLSSHIIGDNPVVPFALMTEWFGHGALHENPGLSLTGIDGMRLLSGIKIGENPQNIRLMTGKINKNGNAYEVDMEIRNGHKNDRDVIHSRAKAILADTIPAAPAYEIPERVMAGTYGKSIEEAYDTVLFHGDELRGIKEITSFSPQGMVAEIDCAPSPSNWIKDPMRTNWVADPLVLDCAYQMAILWCHEEKNTVSLPSYAESYRQYTDTFPIDGITAVMEVTDISEHKLKSDFTFLDKNKQVVATMAGYEATMSESLMESFRKGDAKNSGNGNNTAPPFDREKLLAYAIGNPSEAFGKPYEIFDYDKIIARLPGPPYFFMDRVTKIDHKAWNLKPGGWNEAQYDIPANEWYFNANRSTGMPFCILLEIALQPCGWLAAYAGSALQNEKQLKFRNLGGSATLYKEVDRNGGPLTMKTRMKKVSEASEIIIEVFDFEVWQNNEPVYKGETNFGFFTNETMAQQVGIRDTKSIVYTPSREELDRGISFRFTNDAPVTPDDATAVIPSGASMPSKALRMIDAIETYVKDGGPASLGYIKGTKTVDPNEWFFKAHFYQDPVCPGSLGVESFLQLIKFAALDRWSSLAESHTIEMITDCSHNWIYRGQIVPKNSHIEVEAVITEINEGDEPEMKADGYLKVDGLLIYSMKNFGIKLTAK